MFHDLFSTSLQNVTLITANKRLAKMVMEAFALWKETANKAEPRKLDILPLQAWIERCWKASQKKTRDNTLTLLQPNQTLYLWKNIIETASDTTLLNPSATAQLAYDAWRILKNWGIDIHDARLQTTIDGEHFVRWSEQFLTTCKQKKWIDQGSLMEHLQTFMAEPIIVLPKKIIFIGFIEIPPALNQLVNILKTQDILVEQYQAVQSKNTTYQIACANTEDEIRKMARWTKTIIEQDSDALIGCIVPELNHLRKTLVRVFNETYSYKNNAFNISSGTSLYDEPLIYSAFLMIKLSNERLSFNEISYLLRSKSFTSNEYQNEAALLENEIKKIGNTQYTLQTLLALLSQKKYSQHLWLIEPLIALRALEIPDKKTAADWSSWFSMILKIMGWPREDNLSTRQSYAIEQFQEQLSKLESFTLFDKPWSFNEALMHLQNMVQQIIFQPKTEGSPRVHILGELEAVGIPFSHVWVMGLDHQHWPKTSQPNPLLPFTLQRESQMPHASAERELDFARKLQGCFLQQTPFVALSYPLQDEVGECELEASRLIADFPLLDEEMKSLVLSDATLSDASGSLEYSSSHPRGRQGCLECVVDDVAPAVLRDEKIRGGTAIFKEFSACPFKAFARYRLLTERIDPPQEGLTALERGLLLHETLERFWKIVHSSKQLLKLFTQSEKQLNHIISESIAKTFQSVLTDRIVSSELIALEKKRLETIIIAWLKIEMERPPFHVIAVEKWHHAKMGPLSVNMKIDRIDRLSDNTFALIDYKTGQTTIQSWFGERPDEPQLPLYLTISNQNISCIAFAQIRAGELCFKGISMVKNILPQDKTLDEVRNESAHPVWKEQLNEWQNILHKIAESFYAGNAAVDPKYPRKKCEYCDLHSLCRIHETRIE